MILQQKEISVEEFLSSPEYERCEFEDGKITEKPMPDWNHSIVAMWIGSLIMRYFPQFAAAAELRSRLNPARWRLPDVSVAPWSDTRLTKYAEKPLHLCIEILSEDDTVEKLIKKCREYHAWGVPYCWIIDPERQTAWQFAAGEEPFQADRLQAEPISLPVTEIFAPASRGFFAHFQRVKRRRDLLLNPAE